MTRTDVINLLLGLLDKYEKEIRPNTKWVPSSAYFLTKHLEVLEQSYLARKETEKTFGINVTTSQDLHKLVGARGIVITAIVESCADEITRRYED